MATCTNRVLTLRTFNKLLKFKHHATYNSAMFCRSLLSDAYQCRSEWDKRLQDPILSGINSEQFFIELSTKLTTKQKASAVDVDIYVNSLRQPGFTDELASVVNKLRRSKFTVDTLPSTHFAVVQYLLQNHEYDLLVKVLCDRLNYGIFPDQYTSNMIMSTFLKLGRPRDAAKVAVELMLQEERGNRITEILALQSCFSYLEQTGPEPWSETVESKQEGEDDDEEVFVRVPFIPNEVFDDHFDLKDASDQIGKTLVFFSQPYLNLPIGRCCHLVGLTLYKKWSNLQNTLGEFLKSNFSVPSDCKELLSKYLQLLDTDSEDTKASKQNALQTVEPLIKTLPTESKTIRNYLDVWVGELPSLEAADISKIREQFESWRQQRVEVMQKQLAAFERVQRIERIRQRKREMAERRELIYAFENWNQIEMELDKVEKEEQLLGEKKVEEEYVPPEVVKRFAAK